MTVFAFFYRPYSRLNTGTFDVILASRLPNTRRSPCCYPSIRDHELGVASAV